MGYLCATCGGFCGVFKTSHAHSDKDSCISQLKAENAKLRAEVELCRVDLNARLSATVHALGGIVEGNPTGQHNYLQRIRELRSVELQVDDFKLLAGSLLQRVHDLGLHQKSIQFCEEPTCKAAIARLGVADKPLQERPKRPDYLCAARINEIFCDLVNAHEGFHCKFGQIAETTIWWKVGDANVMLEAAKSYPEKCGPEKRIEVPLWWKELSGWNASH